MNNYALIKDGKVINVIVADWQNVNKIAKLQECEFVNVDFYPVQLGDDYTDGAIYRDWETDRKSTRLNSSHITRSRMPSSA